MSTFNEAKVVRHAKGTSAGGQFDHKNRPANDCVSLGEPSTAAPRNRRGKKAPYDREAWLKKKQERARELQEGISQQVLSLTESENWQNYLRHAASFHSYSFNNVMLILFQRPGATSVAGYKAWAEKGRQVRKGERGIQIFGYSRIRVKDADGKPVLGEDGEEQTRAIFPVLTVFDISQTELVDPSKEPTAPTRRLEGEDEFGLYSKAQSYLESEGWKVTRQTTPPGTNGYTTLDGSKEVVISKSLSEAQSAKTLIHESAHVILHAEEGIDSYVEHRGVKETEAESVAYCVAGASGMDTSAYSIGYVAGWSGGDEAVIRESAERVLKASNTLLSHFEETTSQPVAA